MTPEEGIPQSCGCVYSNSGARILVHCPESKRLEAAWDAARDAHKFVDENDMEEIDAFYDDSPERQALMAHHDYMSVIRHAHRIARRKRLPEDVQLAIRCLNHEDGSDADILNPNKGLGVWCSGADRRCKTAVERHGGEDGLWWQIEYGSNGPVARDEWGLQAMGFTEAHSNWPYYTCLNLRPLREGEDPKGELDP